MSPPTPAAQDGTPPEGPGWLPAWLRDQRVLFLAVGAANTGIGFLAFVAFDDLFTAMVPGLAGVPHNTVVLLCAHVVSVLCAFVLYRWLVFRVRGRVLGDLVRFESVYLASLAVNWVLLNLLVELGRLTPKTAQALIVVVTAALSWFGHKYFSFRRPVEQLRR